MLLTVALIHLAAVISPGANFLIVSSTALSYSRRSGLMAARGVALGSLIYIGIGLLGFAAIISHSPLLFNLIRIAGTIYFVRASVLALASLRKRPTVRQVEATPDDLTRNGAFRRGLLTALSNPTSVLYFLSLFTTFIDVDTPLGEKAAVTVVMIGITLTWYTIVAVTFSHPRVRRVYGRFERWLKGLIGLLWLALAIKLITTAPPT
jgi:threonine efflux protein